MSLQVPSQSPLTRISLPTWVTLSRLLGIPVLFYCFYHPWSSPTQPLSQWWTVAVFLGVAATDWLDGYLARRLHQVTDLGKVLDPLVDKLLVLAPLLLLLEAGVIPAGGVFLIVARELTIAAWRINQSQIQGANFWGKAKTVTQVGAIAFLLAPLPPPWLQIGQELFWFTVALTLISGLIYLLPKHNPG